MVALGCRIGPGASATAGCFRNGQPRGKPGNRSTGDVRYLALLCHAGDLLAAAGNGVTLTVTRNLRSIANSDLAVPF